MKDKCFGMNARGECTCLNSKACAGFDVCPFYKSRMKAMADMEKADALLRAMPEEKQTAIAEKYFSGKMPWKGEFA